MPTALWIILAALIAGAAGGYGGFLYRKNVAEKKIGRTEEYAKKLLDDATRKADDKKKEMLHLKMRMLSSFRIAASS